VQQAKSIVVDALTNQIVTFRNDQLGYRNTKQGVNTSTDLKMMTLTRLDLYHMEVIDMFEVFMIMKKTPQNLIDVLKWLSLFS